MKMHLVIIKISLKEKLFFSQLSGNRADLIAGSESGLKIVI